ncbi:hypothetical protein JQX13_38055 [Archangium violaceum]|uniref:hypothetical protein n=1 Tax=Archangium violaceum TaxID=83451 RepID=UPI00193BC2BF|nr:hypothetical protein [Archangium violaceum]QRK05901.1 hypothetical protein JQX13_38055 [Archangium violaceum]
MKRWWTLVLALVPLAGAWAQGGTGTQGTTGTERETPGAATCVTRALQELFLSQHDAVLLCQGAESDEPVECFRRTSEQTFLDKTDILSLCSPTLSGEVEDPL